MGAIVAKFRKAKTTTEKLEHLEEQILQIEKYTFNTQEQKKRFVGNFLTISIGVYVIAFIIFYFVYFPPTWKERIAYSVPMLAFPLVIFSLRKMFTWYFQRKLNKNSDKLTELRAEKKKILEHVMDNETYKVAVNLLARFGDKNFPIRPPPFALTPRPASSPSSAPATARSAISSVRDMTPRPVLRPVNSAALRSPNADVTSMSLGSSLSSDDQQLRRRTPFPIINQESKSTLERIVDILVGDGPQDRFGMICKDCFAHNGMALKEEFDYITYRCAFCNALNPARKARPIAPRLPNQPDTPSRLSVRDSSDVSSSADESDSERVVPHFDLTEQITKPTENAAPDSEMDIPEEEQSSAGHSVDDKVELEAMNENGHADLMSAVNDEFKKEM